MGNTIEGVIHPVLSSYIRTILIGNPSVHGMEFEHHDHHHHQRILITIIKSNLKINKWEARIKINNGKRWRVDESDG